MRLSKSLVINVSRGEIFLVLFVVYPQGHTKGNWKHLDE
jgi:hypothetical protein